MRLDGGGVEGIDKGGASAECCEEDRREGGERVRSLHC